MESLLKFWGRLKISWLESFLREFCCQICYAFMENGYRLLLKWEVVLLIIGELDCALLLEFVEGFNKVVQWSFLIFLLEALFFLSGFAWFIFILWNSLRVIENCEVVSLKGLFSCEVFGWLLGVRNGWWRCGELVIGLCL